MLSGSRIVLRAWSEEDLKFFQQIRNDVDTQLALLAQPKPNSRDRVRKWLEDRSSASDGLFFVITLKTDQRAIGFIELREIHPTHRWGYLGICIDASARGAGIGSEALGLLESYAQRVLMLRKIVLSVAEKNQSARRLYESAGYVTVGIHREHCHVGGDWLDTVLMEKLLRGPIPASTMSTVS